MPEQPTEPPRRGIERFGGPTSQELAQVGLENAKERVAQLERDAVA